MIRQDTATEVYSIQEHEINGITFIAYVNAKGETSMVVGNDKNDMLFVAKPKQGSSKNTEWTACLQAFTSSEGLSSLPKDGQIGCNLTVTGRPGSSFN